MTGSRRNNLCLRATSIFSNIKNSTSRYEEPEKRKSNMSIPQQKPETMVRNKVTWQKNILPGGRIDWVIVHLGGPVTIKTNFEAQIVITEIFEKNNQVAADIGAVKIPLELEDKSKKNFLDLNIGGSSREMVTEATEKQETATSGDVTEEIAIFGNETSSIHEGMTRRFGGPHKTKNGAGKVTVGLKEAGSMTLKDLRVEGVNEAPRVAAEIFTPSLMRSQNTPAASRISQVAAEKNRGSPGLEAQSMQGSRTASAISTPKRARNNPPQSRSISLKPSPSRKPHPADILKSFRHNHTTNPIYLRPMYPPVSDKYSSKSQLTKSDTSTNTRSLTLRPKTSVSAASRLIRNSLGLRAIPRTRRPQVDRK
ncbi:hypothetical protein SBOR_2382 [Sclerotinia borealis F-4128]|uniref:Uncharacterized protein n=1 Tax=Sclerotinia borealis (strain F-4128) TaxID=1432307 RepID=W9CRP3_SCLBF|nr:hypothetical protein SBOR_2382 [Sclerotinia borealis F-4128]